MDKGQGAGVGGGVDGGRVTQEDNLVCLRTDPKPHTSQFKIQALVLAFSFLNCLGSCKCASPPPPKRNHNSLRRTWKLPSQLSEDNVVLRESSPSLSQ